MTAVEWLIEQLEKQGDSWENVSIGRIQISIKVDDYLSLQQQAKQMEKQQIIEWETKAKKWDDLEKKISAFYEGEEGDLFDIGEVSAMAFGWI